MVSPYEPSSLLKVKKRIETELIYIECSLDQTACSCYQVKLLSKRKSIINDSLRLDSLSHASMSWGWEGGKRLTKKCICISQ